MTQTSVPVIGVIDYADWVENSSDGLPFDQERRVGFSDLVELESLGPYYKFVWLDWKKGEPLPRVEAICWASYREMHDDRLRVTIDYGDGQRKYDVTHLLKREIVTPFVTIPQPVEREALMRAIRVLIREHHGHPTTYTP